MELSREDIANTNMLGPDGEEYEKIKVHYVCGGKENTNKLIHIAFRLWKRQHS